MKRIFLALLLFFSLFVFKTQVVGLTLTPAPAASSRFAACDLCGYCPPDKPPASWEKCRLCLYPNAGTNPATRDTLKINATTNTGPTPQPGRQHTVIGCIKTDLASFSQEGAAASVVQTLLNIIFSLIGGIAFLYLMYGAFTILTSQADPERLNYGRRLIYGAVVGLIFSLLSAFIVNFIASGILKIPGF